MSVVCINGFTLELKYVRKLKKIKKSESTQIYLAYFKDAQKLLLVFYVVARLNLVYDVHHSGNGQYRRKITKEF